MTHKDIGIITLGNNLEPPNVCMQTTQAIYEHVREDDFNVEKFNAILMACVTYLDKHNVNFGDKGLPWAELCQET